MNKIRVVVFDDNELLRDSISLLISDDDQFFLAGAYANCKNLVLIIENTRPDVIVMDIDMPGISGIEAVGIIRKNYPGMQVLMQTIFDNDEKIFAAIKAGANGYILKNAESRKLLESISDVYSGGVPMTPSVARKVLKQFQGDGNQAKDDFNLSNREKEVLSLLVNGKSYKMIANDLEITYDTVRAHMKKIYEKLHVSSMTEAVAKAINQQLF